MSDLNRGASTFMLIFYRLLRVLMRTGVFPVKVTGRQHWKELDEHSGVIATANHEAVIDVGYMNAWLPRPAAFICHRDVLATPVLGPWLVRNGFLPVYPGEPHRNAQVASTACDRLLAGGVIGIFPGGKYDKAVGGVISDFKPGAARLAIQAQVPMLPAGIRGTRRMMPWYTDDSTPPLMRCLFLPFRRVELAFGAPIYPTQDGNKGGLPLTNTMVDIALLTQLLQTSIAELAGLRSACPI